MFRNFFKIAFRNLFRNKGFSIINISGLAVGMASAILILLWIQNEVSYDQFHANKNRIYEAWNKATFSGKLQCWNTTPKILARTLEHDLPEVERAVRVNWPSNYLFSVGEKRVNIQGNIVDTGFLQMFSFPLLRGNPITALNDMHSIVLTEKLAKELYGNEDAMGKIIKLDNKDNFTVTGILKDLPNNTRFDFAYLLPWSYLRHNGDDDSSWGNNSTRTYVMLKPNATLASVAPKVKTLKTKYSTEDLKWEMFLYPMSRWRLYSSFTNGVEDGGGQIEFVRLFGIIAAFILLIACINFMNLSTARSEKRAKEVGIRKVVGAQKIYLISQFIGESILIALIAGMLAIGIVQLSLHGFNQLTGKKLFIDYGNGYFWITAIGFVIFTGILAGSYPAFFLSSFQPVKVLKGTFKAGRLASIPRKVLVVVQFSVSVMLIIGTIVVYRQIQYAKDRPVNYSREGLLQIFMNTPDLQGHYDAIRADPDDVAHCGH